MEVGIFAKVGTPHVIYVDKEAGLASLLGENLRGECGFQWHFIPAQHHQGMSRNERIGGTIHRRAEKMAQRGKLHLMPSSRLADPEFNRFLNSSMANMKSVGMLTPGSPDHMELMIARAGMHWADRETDMAGNCPALNGCARKFQGPHHKFNVELGRAAVASMDGDMPNGGRGWTERQVFEYSHQMSRTANTLRRGLENLRALRLYVPEPGDDCYLHDEKCGFNGGFVPERGTVLSCTPRNREALVNLPSRRMPTSRSPEDLVCAEQFPKNETEDEQREMKRHVQMVSMSAEREETAAGVRVLEANVVAWMAEEAGSWGDAVRMAQSAEAEKVGGGMDDGEWPVEGIVGHRDPRGGAPREHRVRWRGWSSDDDSYLPAGRLEGCESLTQQHEALTDKEKQQVKQVRAKRTKQLWMTVTRDMVGTCKPDALKTIQSMMRGHWDRRERRAAVHMVQLVKGFLQRKGAKDPRKKGQVWMTSSPFRKLDGFKSAHEATSSAARTTNTLEQVQQEWEGTTMSTADGEGLVESALEHDDPSQGKKDDWFTPTEANLMLHKPKQQLVWVVLGKQDDEARTIVEQTRKEMGECSGAWELHKDRIEYTAYVVNGTELDPMEVGTKDRELHFAGPGGSDQAELEGLMKLGAGNLKDAQDLEPGTERLPGMWVRMFKPCDADDPRRSKQVLMGGKMQWVRAKSRLVVGGHLQKKRTGEPNDCPSATGREIRVVSSVAAEMGWQVESTDVSQAFCQAHGWHYMVAVKMPAGGWGEGTYLDLETHMYGLPASPTHWWLSVKDSMEALGLTNLRALPTTFVLKEKTGLQGLCALTTDDFFSAGNERFKMVLKELFGLHATTPTQQAPFTHVGLDTEQDKRTHTVTISSRRHVECTQLIDVPWPKSTDETILGDEELTAFQRTMGKWGFQHKRCGRMKLSWHQFLHKARDPEHAEM